MAKHGVRFGHMEILESMLDNARFHDLTIKLRDGEVGAHKAVLAEVSEVFASMLTLPMYEASSGIIELPDTSVSCMRVFLRLLYTGHVDAKDWDGEEMQPLPLEIMFNIVDLGKKYMVAQVHQDSVDAIKGRLRKALCSPPEDLSLTAPVDTWRVTGSAEGGPVRVRRTADRSSEIVAQKPVGTTVYGSDEGGWVKLSGEPGFMIVHDQGGLRREEPDIETLQRIFQLSVAQHVGAVRTSAILLAAKSATVKKLFDKGSLHPELQSELQAVWPVQLERPCAKRSRLR